MRIIIVGAGIAGLSTYLHLRKYLPNTTLITIYESHHPRQTISSSPAPQTLTSLSESTAIVGGGLGISPNGMRVLRDLNIELRNATAAQGFPVEQFVFRGANGWALGSSRTGDKSVKVADAKQDSSEETEEDEEFCVASSRHGLRETLLRFVLADGGKVIYAKILGVEKETPDGKPCVRFTNASGEEEVDSADLVIGADGVKSVVRRALFGDDKKAQPTYTGLSGIGGFLSTPLPQQTLSPPSMHFTFGGNGFFGYAPASQSTSDPSLMWWSTFETASLPSSSSIDPQAIKAALQERHKKWRDPVIQHITQEAEVESVYPTWVLADLPHWGEKGVVLIGDAAHAMDPTTGQGASQALEDSQTLALLLKELLASTNSIVQSEEESIDLAIKLLYEVRKPRVHEIVERGRKMSSRKANVGIVAEYFMYFFLWMVTRFPSIGKVMLGDVNKSLYGWSAKTEIAKVLAKRRSGDQPAS